MKKLPDKIRLGKYILMQSQGDFLETRSDELALNKSTVAQIVFDAISRSSKTSFWILMFSTNHSVSNEQSLAISNNSHKHTKPSSFFFCKAGNKFCAVL